MAAVLERLSLDFSWTALLYALGYEDRLSADKVFLESESPEDVLDVFNDAVQNTEASDLPQVPEFLDKRKFELRSSVLGCTITVELRNQDRSLFLAEAILAALEAFLATSLNTKLLPYSATLRIKIIPTDFLAKPFEWTVIDGQTLIEVHHSTSETIDVRASDLIITITTQIAIPTDLAHFESLFRDEQAMGRAINLTNIAVSIGNILGSNPKLPLMDWTQSSPEAFPLRSHPRYSEQETLLQN